MISDHQLSFAHTLSTPNRPNTASSYKQRQKILMASAIIVAAAGSSKHMSTSTPMSSIAPDTSQGWSEFIFSTAASKGASPSTINQWPITLWRFVATKKPRAIKNAPGSGWSLIPSFSTKQRSPNGIQATRVLKYKPVTANRTARTMARNTQLAGCSLNVLSSGLITLWT